MSMLIVFVHPSSMALADTLSSSAIMITRLLCLERSRVAYNLFPVMNFNNFYSGKSFQSLAVLLPLFDRGEGRTGGSLFGK